LRRGQRIKQCSRRAEARGAEERHVVDAVGAGQATLHRDAAAAEHAAEPGDAAVGAGRSPNVGVAPLPSRSKGGKVCDYVVWCLDVMRLRGHRPWLTSPLQLLLPLSQELGLRANGSVVEVRRRRKMMRSFMTKDVGHGPCWRPVTSVTACQSLPLARGAWSQTEFPSLF
jgi:hypothetical protein